MRSKAAGLLSTGAILAAAAAVWPTSNVFRANHGGVDTRLLWVLVPLLSSLGGFVAVRRPAWGPLWVLTGISFGFVVLTSWSIGLYFGPAAVLQFVAAIAHLASTRPTWRALPIPGWFVVGATTVCILFVLRDLGLSRDFRIVEAPAIVNGAWIGVGAWTLLVLSSTRIPGDT